jgi:hypothetical protein
MSFLKTKLNRVIYEVDPQLKLTQPPDTVWKIPMTSALDLRIHFIDDPSLESAHATIPRVAEIETTVAGYVW